jgi:hypothetical protein
VSVITIRMDFLANRVQFSILLRPHNNCLPEKRLYFNVVNSSFVAN